MSSRPFAPAGWTRGGHRQTLLGFVARRGLRWEAGADDVVVEAGDDVRLLARITWHPGERATRPALVIVHGLGGCDAAGYAIATGRLALARGWHVARMNMRGAGDAEPLCARLYNAGLDGDLLAVLAAVAAETPRLAVVGFSLGANLALLALARGGARLPPALLGVAAVSPPLDLAACAQALERPANRLYQSYFVRNLKAAYRRRQRRRPDLYEAGRERGLSTVRQYDDVITAPYGGFASAAEYYRLSSAGPRLGELAHPALIVAADDDPMVPRDSVARWPLPSSGLVRREMLPTGGHVGFVAPTEAPGRFWAAERTLGFVDLLAARDDARAEDQELRAARPR
ncbi:MAG TPA: alpha/beta fold hydrolase [Vicinamibacteria bacterium]|nr:alpha/beta fold hydrolase [Vicinamibacteria bacterium]